MSKFFNDYSDTRLKHWCIYCSKSLSETQTNRDHIPPKSFLQKPYPPNLPVNTVCVQCNEGFSKDEEYFAACMSAILSGTTEPKNQVLEIGKRIFVRNKKLREMVDKTRQKNSDTEKTGILWKPDFDRLKNVILKVARGHAFYENGECPVGLPYEISALPLQILSRQDEDAFFGRNLPFALWPEVGSRWMQRLCEDSSFDEDGFLIIQPNHYRFKIKVGDGIKVRSVIHEYLATTVHWLGDG